MLDERKVKILEVIIRDYIQTGEPVGSRTIAKKYDLGISSATIRNEMADLEELGYIEQLHSSSGRIPSDKGYRLYVDNMMQLCKVTPEEELIIKSQLLTSALYEVDKIVKEATVLLSKLTKMACIVRAPSINKSFIKRIQLIGIDRNDVLAVIITDSGIIRNNVIKVNRPINAEIIQKLNQLINTRLIGLTIEDMDLEVINNLRRDLYGHDDIFNALIPALYESLKSMEISEVYSQGTTNILNYPEYSDINKAREFLNFISDTENIRSLLLDRNSNDPITISIGEENFLEGARDCTIITSVYSIDDRPLGSIGIIGPRRMNYEKVISVLNEITRELNININNIYIDDE